MRVAIALSILALVITLATLALSLFNTGNLSRNIEARVYQVNNEYYLVLNVSNPLPLPIVITVSQSNTSSSITVQPYGSGSVRIPITQFGIPVRVSVEIPGLASATYEVTIGEG